jgi:hypothetical protein
VNASIHESIVAGRRQKNARLTPGTYKLFVVGLLEIVAQCSEALRWNLTVVRKTTALPLKRSVDNP